MFYGCIHYFNGINLYFDNSSTGLAQAIHRTNRTYSLEGNKSFMRNAVVRILASLSFSGLTIGCINGCGAAPSIPPFGGSSPKPNAIVGNAGQATCSLIEVVTVSAGNCPSPASAASTIPSSPGSSIPGITAASPAAGNGAPVLCKRGIAWDLDTIADAKLLSKSVSWWYNWSPTPQAAVSGGVASVGMAFVPMLWNGSGVGTAKFPPNSSALLGFNEPDLSSQANMTEQSAASLWPQVETMAKAQNIPQLISPAIAYNVSWTQLFMSLCTGCEIDGIAFHAYTDNVTDIQNEVKELEQFNKPIWLTEFACNHNASNTPCSLSDSEAFMNATVPWLESQGQIARYAWFSGSNVLVSGRFSV